MIDGLFKVLCGSTVLCDGTAAGGICEELTINGQRVTQADDIVRSDWQAVFGRGNRLNQLTLKISTQWTTMQNAVDAAIRANDSLPSQANFTLQLQENSSISTWTMAPAAWGRIDPIIKGYSTLITYTVEGGRVSASNIPTGGGSGFDGGNGFGAAQTDVIDGGNVADNQAQAVITYDGGSF